MCTENQLKAILDTVAATARTALGDRLRGAYLYGSYARGEATAASDIDVIVVGGANFRARDIFAFGEELRQRTQKDVDAFEIREVNTGTPFYESIMREGVRIA